MRAQERQTKQRVDISAANYNNEKDASFVWIATEGPLEIPISNLESVQWTGTSVKIFFRGVGVSLTHTDNLLIKKLRETRETSELELET